MITKMVEYKNALIINNPYAYTGREYDTSEFYYYRARYYDQTI